MLVAVLQRVRSNTSMQMLPIQGAEPVEWWSSTCTHMKVGANWPPSAQRCKSPNEHFLPECRAQKMGNPPNYDPSGHGDFQTDPPPLRVCGLLDAIGKMPSMEVEPFRLRYLQRLSFEGILLPVGLRPPKSQTVVIFDWDDTLLPTTYIQQCGQELPEYAERSMLLLEAHVGALMGSAVSRGKVFVITNATAEWVRSSAEKYLPKVLPVLDKVNVISAREAYEEKYPDQFAEWKMRTFLDVKRQLLGGEIVTNIICLGDSPHEMKAAEEMGKKFERAVVKIVKLRDCPTPLELLKQISLIHEHFDEICDSGKPMKINLAPRDDDCRNCHAARGTFCKRKYQCSTTGSLTVQRLADLE